MAPWMIAHHAPSGTFFYPPLGPGYEYTAYGPYPAPSGAGPAIIIHKVIPFCIPLLFLFLIEWVLGDRDEQGEAILALSAAAFCAALLDTPIVPPGVEAQYAAVQQAIPTDAPALASVDNPFLFDFRARAISIADYPGAASLPPGWPSHQDGEALARYLLANHLRYLVYDYSYFADFDLEAPHVIADASRTQWIHSEARITLRPHQQYAELAMTRRRLYDDGKIYILDLATPANGSNPPPKSSNLIY